MSSDKTRDIVRGYLDGHATGQLADDAVFTMMGTNTVVRGRENIGAMLAGFYHGVFEAHAEERHLLVGDGWAVLEADVVGELRSQLGDIAPSERQVTVPLCVVYEVDDDAITGARIYLETDRLRGETETS